MRPLTALLFVALSPFAAGATPTTLPETHFLRAAQTYGELRAGRSVTDAPLRVAGRTYEHGIGTHAVSEIPFPIPADTVRFTGAVGVDDGAGAGRGSVRFRILSGDTILWESPVMKGGDPAVAFDLPVSGTRHRTLYLQADDLDGNTDDHADWLDLTAVAGEPAAAQPARVIDAAEFGIRPGDTEDTGPKLRRALAALRDAPGSTMRFAPGEYHFHGRNALRKHFHISNHEQPLWQPVAIPLVDLRGITLDGAGSRFVFHGDVQPILLMDSTGVVLKNFRVDYDIPRHSQGRIVKLDTQAYEVEIDPKAFPHELRNGGIVFKGADWERLDRGTGILFDGETGAIRAGTSDYTYGGKTTAVGPNRYRVERNLAQDGAKVGDHITYRHDLWISRPHPAITLFRADKTRLDDIVIHASHGMGLVAQRSRDIRLTGGGVYPAPGRVFSTNADATHFSNCAGEIVAENALYSGMMDDAINVHTTCLRIVALVGPRTIRCRYMHGQAYGFEIAESGERLRFIKAKTLEDGDALKVVSTRKLSSKEIEYTLDRDLPAGTVVGDAVENADFQPSVTFRNNTVKNNRARGSLFTTNGPVLIENNRFESIAGSAILLAGDANGWFEAGACREVTIRKNTFVNNLTSRFQFTEAIISIYPEVPDLKGQKKRYHANVRILDNDFETFDVPLVYAISTDTLEFSGNRVNYNTKFASWKKPPFIFKGCENIVIKDNTVTNAPAGLAWPK